MIQHVPAFYHPDIDSEAPTRHLQRTVAEWEDQQPSVRRWCAALLQYRHYKHCREHEEAASRCTARRKGKRKAGIDDDEPAEESDGGRIDSDWEGDFAAAERDGFTPVDPLQLRPGGGWKVSMPMPDRLYIELVRTLLSPNAEAYINDSIKVEQGDASLARTIHRQLFLHGRYHLFWAHVTLVDPTEPDAPSCSRLIPALFRVHSRCRTDSVRFQDCLRCLPMSQLPLLLDYIHSGGAHLKDSYATLSQLYVGIPRKAVRLFAAKCIVCNRVDKKQRNQRPPRVIQVAEVRQRYTLDLIDLKEWRKGSTGEGRTKRYVAHMIDYSSKFRWAVAIKEKTASEVVNVLRLVFTNSGHPAVLHTDNGTEFDNAAVTEECRAWGVRIIHGRPYHPESQGVIERANGVLQTAMEKYRESHRGVTDWTFIMSQALRILNQQQSSITRLCPKQHFEMHNYYAAQATPLPASASVRITLAQLKQTPGLAWAVPCFADLEEQKAADAKEGFELAMDDDAADAGAELPMEDVSSPQLDEEAQAQRAEARPTGVLACLDAPAATDVRSWEKADTREPPVAKVSPVSAALSGPPPRLFASSIPQLSTSPPTTTLPSAHPQTTVAPTSPPPPPDVEVVQSSTHGPDTSTFNMMPVWVTGELDPGELWNGTLGPHIHQRLRRLGSIANGDCGPASAYYALHGKAATPAQAARLRKDVYDYSCSAEGKTYWQEHCACPSLYSPEVDSLPTSQMEWRTPRSWVTTDFMTMFGGWAKLNVFILERSTDQAGVYHCSISVQTYGRTLLQTDEANCCCIYFQYKYGQRLGHFEAVQDVDGHHRWALDDATVQNCLWLALLRTKVALSVRQMQRKQLTAAANRINTTNEALKVGDLAWLIIPDPVIKGVKADRRKAKDNKAIKMEAKMLVKIALVRNEPAVPDQAPFPTQHFVLFTSTARIEGSYPIDMLERCYPPPEPSEFPTVNVYLPPTEDAVMATEGLRLRSTYRLYAEQRASRQQAILRQQKELAKAVQAANALTAQLAISQSSSAPLPVAEVSSSPILDSPTAPTPSPPASPTPAKDDRVYACIHCKETLSAAVLGHCMWEDCRAPFHLPNTGCRLGGRLHRVNEVMLYCRQACASLDQPNNSAWPARRPARNKR